MGGLKPTPRSVNVVKRIDRKSNLRIFAPKSFARRRSLGFPRKTSLAITVGGGC